MAVNGGPALVSINLSIADAITAIDKIMERREARKAAQEEDFFADLRDVLDAIAKAVNALDDLFVNLVLAYADKDIIVDPAQLKELGKITYDYLSKRNILHRFDDCKGAIEGLAKDSHLNVLIPLNNALQNLRVELKIYRQGLGEKGLTGVDLEWLESLRWYAESKNWQLDTQGEAYILDVARAALDSYALESSGKIRGYLGQARLYARASVPSRKKGFLGG
jgi:hypothetical protein